jgi:hypothetical protein
MTWTLIIIAALFLTLGAIVWILIRPTKVAFPETLNEWLGSEEFRTWLGEDDHWVLWGRESDGRYFAIAKGYLGARHIRKKAFERLTQTPR